MVLLDVVDPFSMSVLAPVLMMLPLPVMLLSKTMSSERLKTSVPST